MTVHAIHVDHGDAEVTMGALVIQRGPSVTPRWATDDLLAATAAALRSAADPRADAIEDLVRSQ